MNKDIIYSLTKLTQELSVENKNSSAYRNALTNFAEKALQYIKEIIRAERYAFFIDNRQPNITEERDQYICVASHSGFEKVQETCYQSGEGFIGKIAETLQSYNLSNNELVDFIGIKTVEKHWQSENNIQNIMGIPLLLKEESETLVLGILVIENTHNPIDNKFPEQEEKEIQIIAEILSSTINNYLLNKRNKKLQKLMADIAQKVLTEEIEQAFLNKIATATTEILNAQFCAIYLKSEIRPSIIHRVVMYKDNDLFTERDKEYKLNETRNFIPYILNKRKLINYTKQEISDLEEKQIINNDIEETEWRKLNIKIRNILTIPIIVNTIILGTIVVGNKRSYSLRRFFNRDEETLKIIASITGAAIGNILLNKQKQEEIEKVKESKNRIAELQSLVFEVSQAVIGEFEEKKLYDTIVEIIMKKLKGESCSIYLIMEDTPNYIDIVAAEGYTKSLLEKGDKHELEQNEDLISYITNEKKVFNINLNELEALIIEKSINIKTIKNFNKKSFRNLLAIPIMLKGIILGIIKVENKLPHTLERFTDKDIDALNIITNMTAIAIENIRLNKQQKNIAAKAAHKIGNKINTYERIIYDLENVIEDRDIEKLKNIIDKLENITEVLKGDIRDFMKLNSKINIKLLLENLNLLIRDNIPIWKAKYPDIYIYLQSEDYLVPFFFDKSIILENLYELVLNAQKAIKDKSNGEIYIITKIIKEATIPQVQIIVENTGSTINIDFIDKLFIAFHSNNNGMGLGLANAKKEIEAHNGTIIYDGSINNKIRFIISIPYLLNKK